MTIKQEVLEAAKTLSALFKEGDCHMIFLRLNVLTTSPMVLKKNGIS